MGSPVRFATEIFERFAMNDIQTIARLNSEAARRELSKTPKGRYSVAEYTGLHFIKFHYSGTLDGAKSIADEINARGDSSHAKAPTENPAFIEHEPATA